MIILTAEGADKAQILRAEAEARATILKAEGRDHGYQDSFRFDKYR